MKIDRCSCAIIRHWWWTRRTNYPMPPARCTQKPYPAHNMDELCLLLQQAHYKDFARQMRTAFLTLSFSCTQGLPKLRRKSERTVRAYTIPPRCSHRLYSTVAKCWRIAGCAAIPAEQAGRSRKSPAPFSFEVPTRILYIDYDIDGQPILRSQQPRTAAAPQCAVEHPRTRDSDLRHIGCSRRFQPYGTTFWGWRLTDLCVISERILRLTTRKKCLLYFPPRRKTRMDNRRMAEEIVRLVDACHGHALVLFTAYRQMAEVRALTDGQWPYPTYQAWRNGGKIIQKFKQSGNGVLFAAGSCWGGHRLSRRYGVFADYRKTAVSDTRPGQRLRTPTVPESARLHKRRSHPPKCRRSCGRALVVPSVPSRTPAWWRFWTNVRVSAASTMTPRWQRCRPAQSPRK